MVTEMFVAVYDVDHTTTLTKDQRGEDGSQNGVFDQTPLNSLNQRATPV